MNLEQAKKILGEEFSRDADFLSSIVQKLGLPINSNLLDVGTGRAHMAMIIALNWL